MMINQAARSLLAKAGMLPVVSHDWWAYMLISGAGGRVFYDPYPSVRYRQHGKNIIGANVSWLGRVRRLRMLLKNRFRDWNTVNIEGLNQARHLLTSENQQKLDEFAKARQAPFFSRLQRFSKLGLYRQTLIGNIGLFVAVILKKI